MYLCLWDILLPDFFHPLQATGNKYFLIAGINTNPHKGFYWNLAFLIYRQNYLPRIPLPHLEQ